MQTGFYLWLISTPNTDRIIVEFNRCKTTAQQLRWIIHRGSITVDVAQVEFMVRSTVKNDETVKIKSNSDIVNDYNDANGTSYSSVPLNLFGFEATGYRSFLLQKEKKTIRIRIKPSDVAVGDWAIGLGNCNQQVPGRKWASWQIKYCWYYR